MAVPARLGSTLSLLLVVVMLLLSLPAGAAETYYYHGQFGNSGGQVVATPEGLAIRGSEVFVADRYNHRLIVYSLSGVYSRNYQPDFSFFPSGVAIDSTGKVYLTDANQGQIHKLSNDLTTVHGVWRSDGDAEDQLYGPGGICLDETRNRVYVADTNHARISVWTMDGAFVTTFGTYGDGPGEFGSPRDVGVDSLGRVYVADYGNDRVQRFGTNHAYQTEFSGSGLTGASMGLTGIMVDSSDRVYVTSIVNHRVYKYTCNGTLLTWVGLPGTGNGQFDEPWDTALDGSGRLYVTDSQNDRVQRFGHNTCPTTPSSVTISPSSPRDNNMLRATASGSTDADGDAITYVYRWYSSLDNANWTYVQNGRTVSSTSTEVGEYWRVQARAYDGRDYSSWKWSASVHILPALSSPAMAASAQQTGSGTVAVTVTLAEAAEVGGELCNVAGRTVAVVPAREFGQGTSSFSFPARSTSGTALPSGQYLLRLRAQTDGGAVCSALVSLPL